MELKRTHSSYKHFLKEGEIKRKGRKGRKGRDNPELVINKTFL